MFGNPFELRDDLETKNKPAPDPFGRLGVDDEPDTEIADIENPAELASSVGDSGQNSRRDVAKTEQLLGQAGTLDLKKTDGPTGYWGSRTSDATKAFQKQNGLKVDGQINPGGETIRALGKLAGQAFKGVTQPKSPRPQSTLRHSGVGRKPNTELKIRHPRAGGGLIEGAEIDSQRLSRPASRERGNDDGDGVVKLTDDAVAENQRAARYLASRDGIGEFSKFVSDGIETDGDKAIAETVDLYHQTAEMNQDQADALIEKITPGLSPENAKRLHSAIMPGEHDQIDELLRGRIPHMDEYGGWFDVAGNSIPNPNADPRILKAAAPSIPVSGMPTLPGGIDPATPEDIDKALENASKDARKTWDALKDATGITDADLFNTPLGKTLLMGNITKQGLGKVMGDAPRTDIAEPQPSTPGFPSAPGIDLPHHTEGRSTEPDRVIDPPEFVPPPSGAETGNQPFPDQSDDLDINGPQILEMKPVEPPIKQTRDGDRNTAVKNHLKNLSLERAEIIIDAALSDGLITQDGNDGKSIETGRDVSQLQSDWENLVRRYGGDPNGQSVEKVNKNDPSQGRIYKAPDGSVFLWRMKGSGKPTLDIHLLNRTGTSKKYLIKRRYNP